MRMGFFPRNWLVVQDMNTYVADLQEIDMASYLSSFEVEVESSDR